MNETTLLNTCPKCGAALPSAATSGLCPRCLMAEAMLPTEKPGGDARQTAPSVEAVAAAFPQLEILELIGQGGMGCVFKARQPKLNRLVALKLLPASLTEGDAAFAGRFEREGQLLARLHHPNIVAVHDSGTAGEFFYLIMEYVDGVNLRQAMRARRFTPGQALAIVPHICDALQFAHDEGVLHRDIKPENILLDAKGRVKLADFGIAKLLGSDADTLVRDSIAQAKAPGLTQSGTALGTPSYMSPEQRDTPADVDHRADIYSLGVVFYELLTGELPQGSLARPSEKSDADPRVDAIVQQALETERDRRQHSAGEVKTQVETVVGSLTAAGKAAPPQVSETGKVSARSKWLPYVGLIALLAGSYLTYMAWHDPVEGRTMRPAGVIVAVVGLFLILKGLLQAVGIRRFDSAPPKAASPDRTDNIENQPSRFSRAAICGGCWAPLLFVGFVLFKARMPVSPGEHQGSPWWLEMVILVVGVLGLAAPFGTTILGWIAVSQIRRSVGRLCGLWLAVLDGLLFPLLALTGLIGWFWSWVFFDLLRAYLVTGEPQLSPLKRLLVTNSTAFTVLATLLTSLFVSILIIRRVWRAVNPPAETSAAAAPAESRSGSLRVIAVLGIAALAIFAVMLFAPLLSHRPSPSATSERHFPKFAHIGGNDHSVEVVHDGSDLHYVFYYAGDFGTSSSGSQNRHSLTWMDEGSIKLRNGRTFGYHRESTGPEHVRVNGTEYDLRQGRVLVLGESGTVEQLTLFPPLTTARDPEELAKLVASARAMNDEPITVEKLRQQLEAAEAQLRGLLRTHAPTHPFLVEVRESIEALKKMIAERVDGAIASATFGPVIERVLPFDRHFIDFQSGSVMRPDYEKFGVDGADWEPWIQQTGADAMVEESPQPGFEPPAPNDHGFPRLIAFRSNLPERRGDRESCVFVSEETDDFDSVRPNDADARLKVVTERDLYWGLANGSRPWWFRTRDGAKGVLQILGTSDKPRGLNIRYKLLVQADAAKTAAVGKPAPSDATPAFGPVMTCELMGGRRKLGIEGLNFTSGKVIKAESKDLPDDELLVKWLKERGIDLVVAHAGSANWVWSTPPDVDVASLPQGHWDQATPEQVSAALNVGTMKIKHHGLKELPFQASEDSLPTFAFRARNSAAGLLQITGFTENPPGVKIRYKLAQPADPLEPATSDADAGDGSWGDHFKHGEVRRAQEGLEDALASYRRSLVAAQDESKRRPHDAGRQTVHQRHIKQSLTRIGDVLCAQGDLAGALENYRAAKANFEPLVGKKPADEAQRNELVALHVKIGDVLDAQGDKSGALASFRRAQEVNFSVSQTWEEAFKSNGGDYNPTTAFKPEELRHLAANPKSHEDFRRLMWLINRAGAEKDAGFRYLLDKPELRKNEEVNLALIGYDYSVNGNPKALDELLAKLARERVGSDSSVVVALSFVDEWDRVPKAVKSHFSETDGAGATCHVSYKIKSAYYFPRNSLKHEGKAGEGAPLNMRRNK